MDRPVSVDGKIVHYWHLFGPICGSRDQYIQSTSLLVDVTCEDCWKEIERRNIGGERR